MSAFFQALNQGYAPQQILSYLSKSIPKMSKPIKNAQKAGYTVQQILGFLSKNFDQQDRLGMTETERHTANRKADAERTKHGLKMAATAVAAPIAASVVGNALSRALPSGLANLTAGMNPIGGPSNIPQQPQAPSPSPSPLGPTSPQQQAMPQQQTAQALPQQPPIGYNVTSVTQPQVNTQAQVKSNKINELWEAVSKGNVSRKDPNLSMFLKMARQFNHYRGLRSKEQFEQLYDKFEELQGQGLGMPEIARKLTAANEEIIGQKPESMEPPSQELDVPKEEVKRAPIAKSETVATPHGVGEVREVRNGQAIVDVDGKLHKVKEEELEASPIPEKELADLYEDLIKGIEGETGEDVSRMVQWAGYDPKNNTLTFLPHTGKLYKYGDISPEDAALLTDILSTRKTSGENFIGAWKAGSKSPIGAALSKLIRKLQSERGGKGNEYEETHEPIYSAYEPAIQAKKKKKKK